jgi:hypothetical protein
MDGRPVRDDGRRTADDSQPQAKGHPSSIVNRQSRIGPTGLVVLALLLVSVVIGREVYARLIVLAPPLNFDEAAHSLPGFYIMRDVLKLDLRAFWGDTHIQTLWPPGFSYLQAPVLFALGRTDEAARLFAYFALVLGALMSVAVIRAIKPEYAPVAGLVSGLIALSAPGWLSISGWAMQETPVALVVFVVFWCFLRALRTQRARWFAITGCALFFLFLTKYNYAAFALAAIGLVDVGGRVRQATNDGRRTTDHRRPSSVIRHLFSHHNLATFAALYLPFVLGLAFWFFGGTDIVGSDVKWRDFNFFVTNENSGYAFWSEQNLLFYVRTAANWLMPHPLLALAALLGAAWAVARVRHPGVTLLALFFVIGFVLATLHPLKADRYVAPVFPSLWVLAGLGAADLLAIVIGRAGRRTAPPVVGRRSSIVFSVSFAVTAFALALASWLTWLPRLQPVWYGDIADALRAGSYQIAAWQQPERPVLIIGTFGELSPPLFEWRLRTQPAFANGNIQYDAPPGDGSDIERVASWLQSNPGTQVTLIQLAKDSALYNTDDMRNKNAWRQTLVSQFGQVEGYKQVDSVTYLNGSMVISYYLPQ